MYSSSLCVNCRIRAVDNRGYVILSFSIEERCNKRYLRFLTTRTSRFGTAQFRRVSRKEITRRLTEETAQIDNRFVSLHGESILRDTDGLSCNLLHPSDEGHILMGQALAEEIQKYI